MFFLCNDEVPLNYWDLLRLIGFENFDSVRTVMEEYYPMGATNISDNSKEQSKCFVIVRKKFTNPQWNICTYNLPFCSCMY